MFSMSKVNVKYNIYIYIYIYIGSFKKRGRQKVNLEPGL